MVISKVSLVNYPASGHLAMSDDDDRLIAVFAPQTWTCLEVLEDPAPSKEEKP
jgi:hypothetical protein